MALTDLRTGDPRTKSLEGCVVLQQLRYNYTGNLCQCYKPKLMYALYVIVMHIEGISYSIQHYSNNP